MTRFRQGRAISGRYGLRSRRLATAVRRVPVSGKVEPVFSSDGPTGAAITGMGCRPDFFSVPPKGGVSAVVWKLRGVDRPSGSYSRLGDGGMRKWGGIGNNVMIRSHASVTRPHVTASKASPRPGVPVQSRSYPPCWSHAQPALIRIPVAAWKADTFMSPEIRPVRLRGKMGGLAASGIVPLRRESRVYLTKTFCRSCARPTGTYPPKGGRAGSRDPLPTSLFPDEAPRV